MKKCEEACLWVKFAECHKGSLVRQANVICFKNTCMSIWSCFLTNLAESFGSPEMSLSKGKQSLPFWICTFIQICTKPKRSKTKPQHSRTQDRLRFRHFFQDMSLLRNFTTSLDVQPRTFSEGDPCKDVTQPRRIRNIWLKQLGNLYPWRWQAAASYSSGF